MATSSSRKLRFLHSNLKQVASYDTSNKMLNATQRYYKVRVHASLSSINRSSYGMRHYPVNKTSHNLSQLNFSTQYLFGNNSDSKIYRQESLKSVWRKSKVSYERYSKSSNRGGYRLRKYSNTYLRKSIQQKLTAENQYAIKNFNLSHNQLINSRKAVRKYHNGLRTYNKRLEKYRIYETKKAKNKKLGRSHTQRIRRLSTTAYSYYDRQRLKSDFSEAPSQPEGELPNQLKQDYYKVRSAKRILPRGLRHPVNHIRYHNPKKYASRKTQVKKFLENHDLSFRKSNAEKRKAFKRRLLKAQTKKKRKHQAGIVLKNTVKAVARGVVKSVKAALGIVLKVGVPWILIMVPVLFVFMFMFGSYADRSNFKATPDMLTRCELYYSKKEQELIIDMKKNLDSSSSTNEVFGAKIGHNPLELAAILTVRFGKMPVKDKKGNDLTVYYKKFLDNLFNVHYKISSGSYEKEVVNNMEMEQVTDTYRIREDFLKLGIKPGDDMEWTFDFGLKKWFFERNGIKIEGKFRAKPDKDHPTIVFTYNSESALWEHKEKIGGEQKRIVTVSVKTFKADNFKDVCLGFTENDDEKNHFLLLAESGLSAMPFIPPFDLWKSNIKQNYGYDFVDGKPTTDHKLILNVEPEIPIKAGLSGTVTNIGFGEIDITAEDGFIIKYSDVNESEYKTGDQIKAGDALGYSSRGEVGISIFSKSSSSPSRRSGLEKDKKEYDEWIKYSPISKEFNRSMYEYNPFFLFMANQGDNYNHYYFPEGLLSGDVMIYGSPQETFWSFFRAQGFSKEAVAGMMGNISQESGDFNPSLIERAPLPGHAPGIGLVQWSGIRKDRFLSFSKQQGKQWTDIGVQLEYLNYELNTSHRSVFTGGLDGFKNLSNVQKATEEFCWKFEVPAKDYANLSNRLSKAEYYFNKFKDWEGSGVNRLIHLAKSQIGKSYILGAPSNPYTSSVPSAYDCSGFVAWLYFNVYNIRLPHWTKILINTGETVGWNDLKPGDLMMFDSFGSGVSHVSLYIGGGRMIHAANPNDGVVEAPIAGWAYKHFINARRIIK